MSRADFRPFVTLAVIGLAGMASMTAFAAQSENARAEHEQRSSLAKRQGAQRARAAGSRQTYYAHAHPMANYHRPMAARGFTERRAAGVGLMHDTHLAGGGQAREFSRVIDGRRVHVVRYGNGINGTVDRTIRPGLVSRTFVSGGHILYSRAYQSHVWHQFGRTFAYETFVPAVHYPAAYYAWALGAWPHPITYSWGWQGQPWYPRYGVLFSPYPVYTSPDLWMTDYIIAQSAQAAYQAQATAPTSEPSAAAVAAAPTPDSSPAVPDVAPSIASPDELPSAAPPAVQSGDAPPAPPAPQPIDTPPAPVAVPPAITAKVKAQLDAEIKVQLQEQQAAALRPATLTTESIPPALRPNHVFFQVVEPLDVPSDTPNQHCSLSANDYIRRTGGVSQQDWMIPVVVELSGHGDCPAGLQTRIGLNDLNAMENEQEAQVMEAMQAASKGLGPNGPPSGHGVHPSLIADGSAAPDPGALDAIRHAQ
jgi:hypothetical protein